MVLAYALSSGNGSKYFSAVLGITISTTAISYCAIFPALIRLRYSHPHVRRPFGVPGGLTGAWIISGITTAWAAFTTVMLLWPGLGTSNPDASLPAGFANQRLQFELSQIIPLAVVVGVGVLFYALGRPTRQQVAGEIDAGLGSELALEPPALTRLT
jgi:amino acid transporter